MPSVPRTGSSLGAAGKAGLTAAAGQSSGHSPWEYVLFGIGLIATVTTTVAMTTHCLSEFAANRPAAKNNHALWFLAQPIKNRLISEDRYVAYSLNRRDTGTAAGGNHEVFPAQRLTNKPSILFPRLEVCIDKTYLAVLELFFRQWTLI